MRNLSRAARAAATACVMALPMAAQSAPPPRTLTLAEAREEARRTSPELAAARETVGTAAGRERQAVAWSNPTLAYSREQTSRAGEMNSQNILTLEQPLELWGPRGARHRAAGLQRAAAEARLAGATARVDYQVVRVYAAAIAAQRRAALADEAAQAFGSATRVSQARLTGGDVSGYQHRRLLLEAARYTALRSEAIVARDSALRGLALITGRIAQGNARDPLLLTDTLTPGPVSLSPDSLLALALRTRPDLRAAQLEAEAAAAGVDVTKAERAPVPVLIGGYKGERLATGESLDGFVVGVSVPLPLWDRRGGAVAAAKGEAGQRSAEAVGARRQTEREVMDAFEAHEALGAQLVELDRQLGDEAAKARRAAQAAYAEGEISLVEWLDAARAYQEAQTTYVSLWSEYVTRRAALERLTGLTLF
jgi:cobalt-zinc-cadmium efflux system outer membrane protein